MRNCQLVLHKWRMSQILTSGINSVQLLAHGHAWCFKNGTLLKNRIYNSERIKTLHLPICVGPTPNGMVFQKDTRPQTELPHSLLFAMHITVDGEGVVGHEERTRSQEKQ